MLDNEVPKNAVLDDLELQAGWRRINPKFGDFVTRVAGEAWGLPLIDQKTKALIAIAVDIVNQSHRGLGNPFAAHINMALKQGATRAEIEELLLFMCVYAGFNKVANCFETLKEIFEQSGDRQMRATITQEDYAIRDSKGKVAFYVLLWKRKGISPQLFDDYWKNVHGPLCAHLPGQHQYWQFHLDRNESGIWPTVKNVDNTCPEEDRFNGIAELTFATEADFQAYLQAFSILMADEHNLFSKAIAYNTSFGNSKTYIDRIPTGEPNGELGVTKFHVMVKKSDAVSVEAFRRYMTDTFAPVVVQSDSVIKFRLHLLEEVDNSRPNDDGVCRYEPLDKQYQAAFEIAFANSLEMEEFFASKEYAIAVKDQAKYIKQLLPFPERSVYTFVYDGKMTLAGQRSSQVANLIMKVGATNQLKEDVVSLMNGKQNSKSGLGHYLQGVQHFGVTVDDMAKAREFYTEVLGGKVVVSESNLIGDTIQNILFQKEELEAIASGIDPDTIDIPHLRSGKDDALDVEFISFGNAVVELLQIKQAGKVNTSSTVTSIPSHIGHINAMHLSFNVKEGIDLNQFAQKLEEECHRRGMTNVVCNRVIQVKSKAERKAVALKYNSLKFCNEEESEPEIDWSEDPMEGWSLFYCKGPSGEQLEFNQVTRKVKNLFRQGVQEYNQANGTSFTFPETKVNEILSHGRSQPDDNIASHRLLRPLTGRTSPALRGRGQPLTNGAYKQGAVLRGFLEGSYAPLQKTLPQTAPPETARTVGQPQQQGESRLYFTFNTPVNASMSTVWDVVVDKIENTSRYNPEAQNPQILARYSDGMLRQMNALGMTVKERIVIDEEAKAIAHTLLDNPFFTGKIVNRVIQPSSNNPHEPLTISYTLDWQPVNESGCKLALEIRPKLEQAVRQAVLSAKEFAEQQEQRQLSTTTKRKKPMIEPLPGKNTDLVKRLFSRGEAFDSEGFITFFTDTPVYQFGNFEVCFDKASIKQSADNFFSQIDAVYHDIKMIQEIGNVVFVEMDVLYWRKDGSMVALPCCDIFRVEGDKFSELRIFMDVNPVFDPSIPVPESASVLTVSQGEKLLPPGIMRRHFAEHPEGKQRVADGYVPKWSLAGPSWAINDQPTDKSQSEQLAAVGELAQAVMAQDWAKVKSYLTDDIFYKVGSSEPRYGRQEVVDFFANTFKNIAVFTRHQVRKIWQEPNVITIEMDAYYRLIPNNQQVTIACCDIYRLRGNQVSEWRVYADMSPWQTANGVVASKQTAAIASVN